MTILRNVIVKPSNDCYKSSQIGQKVLEVKIYNVKNEV